MSTVTYAGRTFDLAAYQEQAGTTELLADLALPAASGTLLTGIRKLAQRFLLELFTERGSMRYLPDRGCDFLTAARQGRLRTPFDVLAAFSAALVDIRQNLTSEETDADPPDEQFADATVAALTVRPGFLALTLRITSQAGTSREVLAPLTFLI